MRNIEKTIARGEKISRENPAAAMLTCTDFYRIIEDTPERGEASYKAFMVGLAIGERIGKKKARARV